MKVVALFSLSFAFVVAVAAFQPVRAAVIVEWSGDAAPDLNWSTGGSGGNWSGAASPQSDDTLHFNHVGSESSTGIVTNRVDAAYPATGSVSTVWEVDYRIDPALSPSYFHTTEITAGRTLLVEDRFALSRYDASTNNAAVHAAVTGGSGSILQIGQTNATTARVELGNHSVAGSTLTTNLDLSGLSTFNAYVDSFQVGDSAQNSVAQLTLAENNVLRGNSLTVGRATAGVTAVSPPSQLLLGETNTLHLNDITIGGTLASGTVEFRTDLDNPSVVIRGLAGGNSRANLTIGLNDINLANNLVKGIFDVSGGTIDARLANLNIGSDIAATGSNTVPTAEGTFTMKAGVVDATTTIVGSNVFGRRANGTLNIQGGEFIGGELFLGYQLPDGGNASARPTGILNVSGGEVTVNTLYAGRALTNNSLNTGEVNLSNGLLTVGVMEFGRSAGGGNNGLKAVGTLTVTGGELNVGTLRLSNRTSGRGAASGTAYLNGGLVTAGTLSVGHVNATQNEDNTVGVLSGTLHVAGGDLIATNLYVGQRTGGGGPVTGIVNLSSGTITAETLALGRSTASANTVTSIASGTLNISGGDLVADTLILGNRAVAGTLGITEGIVNLSGGTLTAGVITRGATGDAGVGFGTAAFNFTGGTLRFDEFNDLDLLQQGGVLAVQTGSSFINGGPNHAGSYTQLSGSTLQITLAANDSPALTVEGAVSLAGELELLLGLGFEFPSFDSILELVVSETSLSGQFSNYGNGSTISFGNAQADLFYLSNSVILTNFVPPLPIPEPSSLLLLGLGSLGLLRRRKK